MIFISFKIVTIYFKIIIFLHVTSDIQSQLDNKSTKGTTDQAASVNTEISIAYWTRRLSRAAAIFSLGTARNNTGPRFNGAQMLGRK